MKKPKVHCYAVREVRNPDGTYYQMRMSDMIIGVPLPGFEVFHVNGNTLDNTRENLRIVPIGHGN